MATSSDSGVLRVSAPGKVILFGEHAVVYKRTGIAGAIGLRLHLTAKRSTTPRIRLNLPDIEMCIDWDLADVRSVCEALTKATPQETDEPTDPEVFGAAAEVLVCAFQDEAQRAAAKTFLYLYVCIHAKYSQSQLIPLEITVTSEIPTQTGIGSSGAFCVCMASVLLQKVGRILKASLKLSEASYAWCSEELTLIRRWASAAESIIHGRASGLDTSICALGGLVKFRNAVVEQFGKSSSLEVILVNTKVERSTGDMVRRVRGRHERVPEVTELIFNAIDEISHKAESLLRREPSAGDVESTDLLDNTHSSLQELCELNNGLLNALGVGHPKSDEVANVLREYGINAKITGAGGGGCVFGFIQPDGPAKLDDAVSRLKTSGYDVWMLPLGCTGVTCHVDASLP